MDTTPWATLVAFRQTVYRALGRRADALFEALDALTGAGPVPAWPHLSLQPSFRRGWGSWYAALACGEVAVEALRQVVGGQHPLADGEPIYAVDVSVWPRNAAATSAERGYYYQPAGPHLGRQPIVAGWAYQWIAQLSLVPDSWTAPLEVERVPLTQTASAHAVAQIRRLQPQLPPTPEAVEGASWPLFVFDAGYDPVVLSQGLAGVPVSVLVRLRANRCFYADPQPVPPGQPGRPPQHGPKLVCQDPTTWPPPDAMYAADEPGYGPVRIQAWAGLHSIPRDHPGRGSRAQRGHIPLVRGTLVHVQVDHLPARRRPPQRLWLWWSGPDAAQPTPARLRRLWLAYAHRFDLEHTFRFLKQALNWLVPHLRTPQQADRWTWLVLLAYTQLRLARPLVADHHLPWERPLPAAQRTPRRVQQAFTALLPTLGTPARAAQPAGRSPGRPKGSRSPPAPRHPVHKKSA
jgi:hypothetical protein